MIFRFKSKNCQTWNASKPGPISQPWIFQRRWKNFRICHFISNQINNCFIYFWYIQHRSFQLCLLLRKARNIWQFGFGLKRIFWLYFNPNSFGEIGICLNFHLENVNFNIIFGCFNQLAWQLFSIWLRNFNNSLKQSSRIKSISIDIK